MNLMAPDRLDHLRTIDPKPLPPWESDAFVEIQINPDRDTAEQEARILRAMPGIVVYSDASGHHGQLGAAAVALDDNLKVRDLRQICIGSAEHWPVCAAELIGIFFAISLVLKLAHTSQRNQQPATILSDSMSGLQVIKSPSKKSGQSIIHAILEPAQELAARGISLRLQWLPGHCDNPGNDTADHLAKEATGLRKTHPFRCLLSHERCRIRDQIHQGWAREWNASKTGGHRRQIDAAPPSIHNLRLFGNLSRGEAYLLTKMRSGHSWLATYAQNVWFREGNKCKFGAEGTVVHVLIDCPKLQALGQNLRKDKGEAMNDVMVMLEERAVWGKQTAQGNLHRKALFGLCWLLQKHPVGFAVARQGDRQEGNPGMGATIGLDGFQSSFL